MQIRTNKNLILILITLILVNVSLTTPVVATKTINQNQKLIFYITDDINLQDAQNQINIAISRLSRYTGTSWQYDIKKISSTHKNWDFTKNNEEKLFFQDVYKQVDLKSDYSSYDIIIIMTSANIDYDHAGSYLALSISFGGRQMEENVPLGRALLEHEIFHKFGLKDEYLTYNQLVDSPCIMSTYSSDKNNKLNPCSQTPGNMVDILSFEEFEHLVGLEGTVQVFYNGNGVVELDSVNGNKNEQQYADPIAIFNNVAYGKRELKYYINSVTPPITQNIIVKPDEISYVTISRPTSPISNIPTPVSTSQKSPGFTAIIFIFSVIGIRLIYKKKEI